MLCLLGHRKLMSVTSYSCGASLVNMESILRLPIFNVDSCCCKLKTKCATPLDVHLMSMYVIAHVFSEISAAAVHAGFSNKATHTKDIVTYLYPATH